MQETNSSPVPKSKDLDGPAVPCREGRRIMTQSMTERTEAEQSSKLETHGTASV